MNTRVAAGSRKGSKVLIHHGYKYQRNKVSNHSIFWRCWRKDCGSFVKTQAFNINDPNAEIVIENQEEHGHDEDEEIIKTDEFKDNLRKEIILNPTAPIKRVYGAVAAYEHRQGGADRADFLPQFTSVKSSMCRQRCSLIPPIPAAINNVNVEDSWAETWRGENFVLDQNNGIGCLIFCTNNDLYALAECDTIYIDGTFKSTPHPYTQVFTIHAMYLDHCVHFATCLMSGKSIPEYTYVLNTVKTRILQLTGLPWQPVIFVCDFEQAIISAVENEFPQALIDGCYFHFTKNLWKKVGELGLIIQYRNDRNLKDVIRKVMALGFLPLNFVTGVFHVLSTSALVAQLMRIYPAVNLFFVYVRDTYILHNSNFPPRRWNLWHRNMDTRTNNFVESFHKTLNTAVMVRHPSLWIFIRHLKDFHTASEIKIQNANRGVARPLRKRKWRLLEQNLLRLKAQYMNGQRNLHSYWSNVCYFVKEFVPRR